MYCNDKTQGCRKPENLKDSPRNCTPEQIRDCHGEAASHACVETKGCEHPERLKGSPGDCSSEQVRQCHGDDKSHLCESRT
jgi:hypothetical protein